MKRIYLLFTVIGMGLTHLCAQSQDSLDTYIDSIYHELGIYKVPTVLIIERGTIIYRGDLLTSINVIENILKKNSCE